MQAWHSYCTYLYYTGKHSAVAPTRTLRAQPCTQAGEPAPLASLAEEDDNKVCLPAKRQRSSTLGIGTVYTPFGSLQEKVRRQSADTAHFDGQRSPCLRKNQRKENWSQNVKKLKLPTSKFKKCACISAAARETSGVTSSLQLNKTVML